MQHDPTKRDGNEAAAGDARPIERRRTRCCIVGGGPAGVMLGLLLARAGVDVVVLEKHADFLRDFRGDTIHPSTLEVMSELGLLDDFLKRPHQEVVRLKGHIGDVMLTIADFSRLKTRCRFLAFMPQWDFLDFLTERARRYPGFHLRMQAEVTDLLWRHEGEEEERRVTGVRAETPDGPLEVEADLVVAADGRGSVVRERAGLRVLDRGAPMDVLWMRISKGPAGAEQTLGRVDRGRILAMIDRGAYWQCAYVIPKGSLEEIRRRGLPELREELARLAPSLAERVHEIRSWDDVKLLTVRVDRLDRWHRPGLLCIGDAAHAMSPIGGVGINLAIQDAVATANLLARPLREGSLVDADLEAVQRRREWPTRVTQAAQLWIQNRVIRRVLADRRPRRELPAVLRWVRRFPALARIPAFLIGVGVRPEHARESEKRGFGEREGAGARE